jgi:hypothetical protein
MSEDDFSASKKALTMTLLDRLTHNVIILNMNGESYRRRKIEN